MKKLLVTTTILMCLIVWATTAFVPSTAKAISQSTISMRRLEFRGNMQAMETAVAVFPIVSVTAAGTGNSTQFGQFNVAYQVEINLMDLSVTESAQLTGVNGYTLSLEAIGQATDNQTPGMTQLTEIYKITGGTGQFTGANGTITLNRTASNTMTTRTATGTFEGYILLPWK